MMFIKKITTGMERRYQIFTVLSPIFMLGEVLMETTIPLVMATLVDTGIKNSDINFVFTRGLLMVLMASFSLFCGAMCGRLSSVAAFGFSKNLRKKLFAKVQDFSFSNMDNFGTDSLVTRLTTDVTSLQNMYQNAIRTAVRSPVMLIFGTIMATRINSRLALLFFIVIPFLAAVLVTIVIVVYPRFRAMLQKYDSLNRVVQENLIAIRVVKAFVRG
ncbi:MAG: ABC transporter ATP-binding protein, partial [Treponema sp.]|nr:ABC transporter ATP-binding protein [Treponema sp.]